MDERLLDIEDLPKPSVRPFTVPRDIFDARFEITDVFGPSHPIWDDDKSDEPEITKANEKNIAMAQGDRESVLNRTGTTVHTVGPFETGGSERNEVALEKGPSTTVSSGFDFATSMDSQRSASAWNGLPSQAQNNEMSCFAGNADTVENMNSNGFGCSNEAIARLGRPRGKGGNRSNEQRRKRRSRAKYEAADEYPKFCSSPRERLNNNFGEDVKTSSPKNQTMNGGRSNGFGAGGGQRGRQEIPSNRPLAPICDNCGDDGHTAPVCPLPRRQDPNGFKCYNCNRLGFHIARDCNVTPSNQSSNREGLRCYNCNSYGHMAIRCSRPPMKNPRIGNNRGPSTRSARRRRTQTENGRKEAKAAQNKPASDFKGLDVICRLMKDKHLREETAKTTPKLYDEMLSLMIDHVSLNLLPSSGKK